MKFNWGTGIFIFLVLFVVGVVSFVIFTLQFDANLVHKDYYEKGVDYSEQMKVNQRSAAYNSAVKIEYKADEVLFEIEDSLACKIDSGRIHIYRPSDRNLDLIFALKNDSSNMSVPRNKLIKGRYIFKFNWFSNGLKYQVDKMVFIE